MGYSNRMPYAPRWGRLAIAWCFGGKIHAADGSIMKSTGKAAGAAAVITAIVWGLTQLSPSLRDLWDLSVLTGAYLVVLGLVSAGMWGWSRLRRRSQNAA